MKKFLILLTFASVTAGAFAEVNVKTPMKCTTAEPYKYRVSYSYFGSDKSKDEIGFGYAIMCSERQIKNEADWDWLQKKLEVKPKVTRVTIMSAAPLSDGN